MDAMYGRIFGRIVRVGGLAWGVILGRGTVFCEGDMNTTHVRLSFRCAPLEKLEEVGPRLKEVFEEMLK